jgi:aspartate kinase
MNVFKFGGASVKDAHAIRNVAQILRLFEGSQLLVVVSAMGKTTNTLEGLVGGTLAGKDDSLAWKVLEDYHRNIMDALFEPGHTVYRKVDDCFMAIRKALTLRANPDMIYDQVVSMGEVISTIILAEWLATQFNIQWIDARQYIITDSSWREGKVDWETTTRNIANLKELLKTKIILTQGFIGADRSGSTTTLGREGSDYSAAIFASCLDAESLTIWKDVPGVMNADPKRLPGAVIFDELPFKEAAEMTYYGASVIHPKTIKPLANKGIPLLVRNFDNPELPGTRIHECTVQGIPPLIVFKDNQCLISFKVTDYTFISEAQLTTIFQTVAALGIHINMMQNSAITFSVCVDFRESKVIQLIKELGKQFEVYYNTGLTLVTIKNYDNKTFAEYRSKPGIVLEQISRSTMQLLIK